MEQDGWIRAEWGMTEKNREARFYSLTAAGRRQLHLEEESWARLTEGVIVTAQRWSETLRDAAYPRQVQVDGARM